MKSTHQLQSIGSHDVGLGAMQWAGAGDAAARGAWPPFSPHALQTLTAQPWHHPSIAAWKLSVLVCKSYNPWLSMRSRPQPMQKQASTYGSFQVGALDATALHTSGPERDVGICALPH